MTNSDLLQLVYGDCEFHHLLFVTFVVGVTSCKGNVIGARNSIAIGVGEQLIGDGLDGNAICIRVCFVLFSRVEGDPVGGVVESEDDLFSCGVGRFSVVTVNATSFRISSQEVNRKSGRRNRMDAIFFILNDR